MREQADQTARIQTARYEEVRNRAQEPSSRTKKIVNYLQDKAKVAKEDRQDSRRHLYIVLVVVEVTRDRMEMVMGTPPIRIGTAV